MGMLNFLKKPKAEEPFAETTFARQLRRFAEKACRDYPRRNPHDLE